MKKSLVVLFVALSIALCGTAFAAEAIPAEKVNPGFVYIGPVGDGGWTYMHDQGRLEMEEAFPGVKSSFVESVPEGPDSARVMETFIRNGSKVIFATSFGYMDFVQDVAKRYPDVVFMHCSGYKRADNVGIYFGRMYQARYLSGLVAGKMTKNNVIGFVAAHPIPEVVRGINAFTLGVRKANPKAEVKVVWLFSWFDPGKEKEATKALIDSGADVIAMHADSGAAPQTAEEAGVYVVGYNNDMSQYAPTKHLTAPIWDWGIVYKRVMEQVTTGTWKSEDIWWGLKEGMVTLSGYGKDVPEEVKGLVEEEKAKIISGEWDVFNGPIKDQSGTIKVESGQSLSDADKLSMNWFVEGVKGDMPK
ncbi:MAG: BMP family ABC transporter substrate-binding protein [Aminobacterium sp.]|jgi:basic membrane protein A|uniref:BMP family ABC transporter substrate-binding protein n=1 Tax=unclassified Aminobacterium TaxID=2685012 RepID=UPI001BD10070|nr:MULTISPECIES: BMP family ABC transporter substrate-binding protein [unclassified Aminobacterium]MDD2206613.1 BMP family ABC transporter substrate-binding protein [Aminobacterium sp.]MDD3425474.1 BMP family ABC transporter substrate-binding protein [Aminobacterium sp.]MDD3706823.1 BMP family ABC transporter substrate-binding protein [Aminobacterium sp.]MDD4228640.1 BMP family ABC transporter substrate-binding protein [Aminobacterium sp.]MDD4551568.1 BMP family ABC transporter substrate-bindi